MDVTSDGLCNASADDCVFYDRITQRYWSETYPTTGAAPATTASTWANAVARCDGLTFGGFTDWRLPTQHELQLAAMHGMRDLYFKGGTGGTASNNFNFAPDVDNFMFWAATTASSDTTNAWTIFLADGTSSTAASKSGTTTGFGAGLTYSNSVICVRGP
jgi:formylglycine-generating enzyme required for sulfatase activity